MAGLAFDEAGSLLKVTIEETGGPQGQEVFVNKFIPNFKMFANIDRSLYFPNFFSWMGETRELSAAPILHQINALAETGEYGLVTNNASLRVVGEKMGEDNVVQVRLWAGPMHGPRESTVELFFEWVSWGHDGPIERIAFACMKTTWVKILGHGLVKPEEFPPFYREFMEKMAPRYEAPDTLPALPEPFGNIDLGRVVFQAKKGPRTEVFLADKLFETSLYDANLVGNLYFSNYSVWMAKLRDAYFFSLAPELYRGIGKQGVMKCVECNIDHLREGMPFDTIYVTMGLRTLYECGAELYFEFFKDEPGGGRTKLAFGNHTAVWMKKDGNGRSAAAALPDAFADHMQRAVREKATPSRLVG